MEVFGLVLAALVTGFLGSLHCVGMCGAIACSKLILVKTNKPAVPAGVITDDLAHPYYSLLFNLSRIVTYALLGGSLAFLSQTILMTTKLDNIALAMRLFGAILIALIGLRFLVNLHWVDKIEVLGLKLWSKLKLYKLNASARQNPDLPKQAPFKRVVIFGMLWGLIPCALVYTMLLTATASGSFLLGASIMFAFGLGTLPAMQGMSLFGDGLQLFARKKWLRQIFGMALLIIAIYVFVFNLQMQNSGHEEHHMHTSSMHQE